MSEARQIPGWDRLPFKQKEADLSRQMGQPVKIDPAQDPEFISLLRQNMGNLEARYGEVLSRVKEQITSLVKA